MTNRAAILAHRPVWPIVALGATALAASMMLGLEWGSVSVHLFDAFRAGTPDGDLAARIVWGTRLPRVLLAALVGAALALAGVLFQALLRNPLASPFTLGIAGGGTLGAFLVLLLFEGTVGAALLATHLAPWGVTSLRALGAFAGVMLTIALVFAVARAVGGSQTVTLLLAGVALNYICAAGVMLLQLIAHHTQAVRMIRWSMGGLDVAAGQIGPTAALAALGLLIVLPALRHLDVVSVDDQTARLLGVPVARVRLQIILGSAVMVGACLAVAGPIGFIGLMVPHIGRLLVGPAHRRLVPATIFLGATLLVLADTLGRSLPTYLLGRAGEIPVGVLTAACGGPFFLALLLRLGRRGAALGRGD